MGSKSNGLGVTTRAAFFDVDETLISTKSMFVFLRYWIECRDGNADAYQQLVAGIHALAENGAPRTEINRMYYRFFTGVRYVDLLATGQDWYREYRELPTAFIGSTLSAIAEHRIRGDLIVLVSGSFRACLEPLAMEVLADRVVCTEPIVDGSGRLTGEVVRPMIGTNKALAVVETVGALNLIADDCFCYGDHSSDLQMLSTVGHPRVVGKDPVLLVQALRNGWPVLPAHPSSILRLTDLAVS